MNRWVQPRKMFAPTPGAEIRAKLSQRIQVRKFEYRPYRMKTGFAVAFFVAGTTLNGLCRDVSDAGIRAEFDGSLAVGESGILLLLHPTGQLKLKARAAYIEKCQVGLVFVFQNERERQATIDYVASIASNLADTQIIEFP